MIRIALSVLVLAVVIFFHNTLIAFGLNIRLTFTFSKILPYMLEFFAVCLIIYQVYNQYLINASLVLRRIVSTVILFAGCGIAFAFNPIYEGDFSHQYREVTLAGESDDIFQEGLTMIALPGCKFCFEKLEEMKYVKNIYPEIPMHVLVVNNDEIAVENYRKASDDLFDVDHFPKSSLLKSIIIDGYPNLIYKSSANTTHLISWSNSGFGSASWDYVLKQ